MFAARGAKPEELENLGELGSRSLNYPRMLLPNYPLADASFTSFQEKMKANFQAYFSKAWHHKRPEVEERLAFKTERAVGSAVYGDVSRTC